MNLVILEGNLGTTPKKIGESTYALRLAIHEDKHTLWVDGLFFSEAMAQGLTAGTRVLINGRLTGVKDKDLSPKVLIDTIEIK